MSKRADEGAVDRVTYGSGDVFADLGIDLTAEDRIKLALARHICRMIAERDPTQAQATMLKVDEAEVFDITRGRMAGFSVERLMKLGAALG